MKWRIDCTFNPGKGIRQGNPLSLYFFVFCIEKLPHAIFNNIMVNDWKPLRVSKHGPGISHLLFTDDLVIFFDTIEEQVKIVLNYINKFCSSSGHKLNCLKSRIFFSRHNAHFVKSLVANLTNIPLKKIWKILWFILFSDVRSNTNSTYILNNMRERFRSSKAKILSFTSKAIYDFYSFLYYVGDAISWLCL